MAQNCPRGFITFTGAKAEVASAIEFAKNTATGAISGAEEAASALLDITFDPVPVPRLDFDALTYPGYQAPARPTVGALSGIDDSGQPVQGALTSVDLSGLNVTAPTYDVTTPNIEIPATPQLVEPSKPGAAPVFDKVTMPTYEGGGLPTVPTLEELQIPTAPTIDLTSFDVARPEFDLPYDHIYSNNLIADTKALATEYLNDYGSFDPDSETNRERWRAMLQGGTGLPANIEQALFDRAIGREDISSEQAIKQAQGEWAARGFSLPGSTLLAREGEIRRANRTERGRINRELTIQLHQQEIDNLRFTVEQGVRLEGQRFEQYIKVFDSARAIVSGSYEVARQLLSTHLEILNSQIQIYQTDVQVFRERVQIELARLEVFRTQLEAERVRGEINQQRIAIYEAQIRALLANVDIYRAEIEGANGLIQAQIGEMELYKTRIDAYRTEYDAQKIKVDLHNSSISAEQLKTNIFESQVRAYGERVSAFGETVRAAGTRATAQTDYNSAVVDQYEASVRAWQGQISARVEKLRGEIAKLTAETDLYRADIAGEQVRGDAFRSNASLAIERSRADITLKLKAVDQQIAQLELAETLGQESLRTAAQTYSQLAASSLSAINASASISDSVAGSVSRSQSCSDSYVLSGEI